MEPFHTDLHTARGFTLVELLVVLGIIILITGVIFSGQTKFNNSVVLASTAYDIALTMRDAQTYGLGTRSNLTVSNVGYGLDFKRGAVNTYTLFADSDPPTTVLPSTSLCHSLPTNGAAAPNAYPGDCIYNKVGATNDALVATYKLGSGMAIKDFCAYNGSWACATSNGAALSQLDIVFERPNGTAFISTSAGYSAAYTQACLTVISPGGSSRYISVNSVSQIVANASSTCP